MAFEGYIHYASYLIGIAMIFDFLDGLLARALNATSLMGKELDSLADLVSFGVAPSIITYQLLKRSINIGENIPHMLSSTSSYELIILFSAFLIAVFSALRLAKFNIDERQTDSFIGLPTPANAMLFASLPLILNANGSERIFNFVHNIVLNPYFLITLIVIQSFLLIAELEMFSLKFKDFSLENNKIKYGFLLISLVALIILHFYAIPLIIFFYILLSIINNWIYHLDI